MTPGNAHDNGCPARYRDGDCDEGLTRGTGAGGARRAVRRTNDEGAFGVGRCGQDARAGVGGAGEKSDPPCRSITWRRTVAERKGFDLGDYVEVKERIRLSMRSVPDRCRLHRQRVGLRRSTTRRASGSGPTPTAHLTIRTPVSVNSWMVLPVPPRTPRGLNWRTSRPPRGVGPSVPPASASAAASRRQRGPGEAGRGQAPAAPTADP